jgi:hypothetical protein
MYAIRNFQEIPELKDMTAYTIGRDLKCVLYDFMPAGYRIKQAHGMIDGCEIVDIEPEPVAEIVKPKKKPAVPVKPIEKAFREYMDENAFQSTTYKTLFKNIYKEVEKMFERDVFFCTETGQYSFPDRVGKLVINLFAPEDSVDRNSSAVIVRIDNINLDAANSIQTCNRVAYDDTGNTIIAQGNDDSIYICVYTADKATIMSILAKYHKTIAAEYATDAAEARRVFNGYLDKKKKELAKSLKDAEAEIERSRTDIIETIRKQKRLDVALIALGESVQLTIKDINDKITEVNAIPDVQKAYFKDRYMVLQTKPLLSEIQKSKTTDKYIFGRISCLINLENGNIRIRNLDFKVSGKGHPHGFSDGNVCLGSINGNIAPLIASYELRAVADLLIAFFKTYNPNDHEGQKAVNWPRLLEDGTISITRPYDTTIFNKSFVHGGTYADYQTSCLHNS